MKRYSKDNKIYNSPITIKSKKEVDKEIINDKGEKEIVKKVVDVLITTNDEKTILAAGYEVYVPPKPPIEVLIERSNRLINKNTDDKILNDFVWNDNEFYLTMENQQNFANMFIAREYLTYPQTIKTKKGFTMLNNKDEVTEFYLAGVNFIKKCLEECWQEKINAESKIREEYK
jgi:hypothetical protein